MLQAAVTVTLFNNRDNNIDMLRTVMVLHTFTEMTLLTGKDLQSDTVNTSVTFWISSLIFHGLNQNTKIYFVPFLYFVHLGYK